MLLAGPRVAAVGPRRSAAGGCTARRYRPDPWRLAGVARRGAPASLAAVRDRRDRAASTRQPQPVAQPAGWPRCRSSPSLGVLVARCCRPWLRRRRSGRRRTSAPEPRRSRPSEPGRGVIRLRRASPSRYADADRPGPARRRPRASTEGELCLVVGRTGVGQVDPARARSTASCRTSPAATSPAGSPSTAATPRTTRRASSPTWSASSARTRWPASSPTRSRRSSPTRWSSSPSPPRVMRKRVEETLDLLGHRRPARPAAARRCPAASSSGSRSARCSPPHPRVLVLDEPTSALDPTGAEEVLAAITRLVHDLGITVVWPSTGSSGSCSTPTGSCGSPATAPSSHGPPADVLATRPIAPPVVELGRLAGWAPLPLSVRDARRAAPAAPRPPGPRARRRPGTGPRPARRHDRPRRRAGVVGPRTATVVAVREVDLDLRGGRGRRAHGPQRLGQVVAAVGPPGLRAPARRARCRSAASTRATCRPRDARRLVGLVPQTPADLLYLDTVAAECAQADRGDRRRARDAAGGMLDRLVAGHRRRPPPARPVRGPAARARPGDPARRRARRSCCSTSRPAASTTPPRRSSRAILPDLAAAGHAVVLSHPRRRVRRRRSPTGWSSWPRARSSPTGPPPRSWSPRRRSRRRSPRSSRRGRGSPSTQVADALGSDPAVTPAVPSPTELPACASRRARRLRLRVCGDPRARVASPGWRSFLLAAVRRGPSASVGHAHGRAVGLPAAPAVLLVVILAELAEGGIDAKALAMLGVLSAVSAALRPLGAGTAGIETVVLPADPRRPGLRAGLRVRARVAPRCSPRRCSPAGSGRGCRSRCWRRPGSASAPGLLPRGCAAGGRSPCSRSTAPSPRTASGC